MRLLLSLFTLTLSLSLANANVVKEEVSETQKNTAFLRGKVVDEKGIPIVGAYIFCESVSVETVSDIDGKFELKFPEGKKAVIVFTYVGTIPKEYNFGGMSEDITITLKDDKNLLDDVVVIGYGNKTRKSLTSSIASVAKEDLAKLSSTNATLDNMLGGTVKGVLVRQSSGEPGAAPIINIRGVTSPFDNMNGQAKNVPLFVIDGIPTFVEGKTLNPLLAIAPSDIESIDVLKDAAATAIYGSRGANGVVIVKTKSGHKGAGLHIEAGYTLSVGNPIKEYKPLNRAEFMNLQDEILKNTVSALNAGTSFADPSLLGKFGNVEMDINTYQMTYSGLKKDAFGQVDTDWVAAVRNKNAQTHQYNFSMRGGSELTAYSFSFNGMNQEGLEINDKFERYNTRLSLDTDLSKKINIGAAINYSISRRNSGRLETGYEKESAWDVRPDMPIYDERGLFLRIPSYQYYPMNVKIANPVAKLNKESIDKNNQVFGNFYAKVKLLKGLELKTDINLSYNNFKSDYFSPLKSQDSFFGRNLKSTLTDSDFETFTTSVNARLDYKFSVANHGFKMMAGIARDRTFSNSKVVSYEKFLSDESAHNISNAATTLGWDDDKIVTGLNSLYSRLSYDYANRYLVELTMRGDKSSKFGPGNRWGYFPSISLGWRMAKEPFMKQFQKLDDLKLRASWGQTGSTNVPDFSYVQHLLSGGSSSYGGKLEVHLKDMLPNTDIKWETTTEINTGLDFSFFARRLYGSLDVFYRYTDGALAMAPHILSSGSGEYQANIVDMSSKGVEFNIGGEIIKNTDFSWSSNLNVSSNNSRIEKLNGASTEYLEDAFIVGQPRGTARGYIVEKMIQSQEEIDKLNAIAMKKWGRPYQDAGTGPGNYLFKDLNGDGRITREGDRDVITKPDPKFFGGWSNTFKYKNFTLYLLNEFSYGGKAIWGSLGKSLSGTIGSSVLREVYQNTWTPENTGAYYQSLVEQANLPYGTSGNDRMVFDNSFFRMKNIMLSYELGKDMSKFGILGVEFSLSFTNLFTLTDWPGLDPNIGSSLAASASSNSDPYPVSKTISLGVKLRF